MPNCIILLSIMYHYIKLTILTKSVDNFSMSTDIFCIFFNKCLIATIVTSVSDNVCDI